eukprot:TRINITY_DN22858_c0_g1_i1.p2 TRINITY_DN22858_c0_g1~~TRINITY_DN22858_c0_g1_i1.p2  ORF type:complete len:161 (-),score=46.48 TRINITY_DN22858_c0_g1_i1:113-595(-)
MGMTAGMLVQNVLKYLLGFGVVSAYLGYNAMDDFFPTMRLTPSQTCPNEHCIQLQKKYQGWDFESAVMPWKVNSGAACQQIVHEENDWGITCDADDAPEPELDLGEDSGEEEGADSELADGMHYNEGYRQQEKANESDMIQVDDSENVEDLMARLKAMQN